MSGIFVSIDRFKMSGFRLSTPFSPIEILARLLYAQLSFDAADLQSSRRAFGAGVHFPKSFQKFAMAESKKKFLEIYALWLYGQGVQEISLKSIVSVIRDPRSIARVRPHYHLRITIKT